MNKDQSHAFSILLNTFNKMKESCEAGTTDSLEFRMNKEIFLNALRYVESFNYKGQKSPKFKDEIESYREE